MSIEQDVFTYTVKTKDTSMRSFVPFFAAIDDLLANNHVTCDARKVTLARQEGYSHTLLVAEDATVLCEKTRELDEIRVGAGARAPVRYRNTAKITILSPRYEVRAGLLDELKSVRYKYA